MIRRYLTRLNVHEVFVGEGPHGMRCHCTYEYVVRRAVKAIKPRLHDAWFIRATETLQ
jgi:hypothetical protein